MCVYKCKTVYAYHFGDPRGFLGSALGPPPRRAERAGCGATGATMRGPTHIQEIIADRRIVTIGV
eukprot:1952771-Pyramimonas_sp.AAC.1